VSKDERLRSWFDTLRTIENAPATTEFSLLGSQLAIIAYVRRGLHCHSNAASPFRPARRRLEPCADVAAPPAAGLPGEAVTPAA
jgi:hypothetical protein